MFSIQFFGGYMNKFDSGSWLLFMYFMKIGYQAEQTYPFILLSTFCLIADSYSLKKIALSIGRCFSKNGIFH